MRDKLLEGVRVAVLVADGFEQLEVTRPVRALHRHGADVRILSLRPGRLRGMHFIWPGRKLSVDDTVATANPADYGALLVPGGFVSPDLLRQSEAARRFVRAMDRVGKPLAVICHGAEVLISAGIVRGRRLTSWPGIADDVRNAGGAWEDREVVEDANWISSRGPQDLGAFNDAMVALFAELAPRALGEAPRPVRFVARALRLASLGVALYAARRALVAARA